MYHNPAVHRTITGGVTGNLSPSVTPDSVRDFCIRDGGMSSHSCPEHLALVVGRATAGRFTSVAVRKALMGYDCCVCGKAACWEVGA